MPYRSSCCMHRMCSVSLCPQWHIPCTCLHSDRSFFRKKSFFISGVTIFWLTFTHFQAFIGGHFFMTSTGGGRGSGSGGCRLRGGGAKPYVDVHTEH